MHAKAQEHLTGTLSRLTANVMKTCDQPVAAFPATAFYVNQHTYSIAGHNFHEFRRAAKSLLRERNWVDLFSEQYITTALLGIITRTIGDGTLDAVPRYVADMVDELQNFSEDQIVLVTVDGIAMQDEALSLGPVTLRRITDEYLQQKVHEATTAIMATTASADDKEKHIANRCHALQHHLLNKVCLEYHVTAEKIRARQRALAAGRRIVDLLRYTLVGVHPELFLGASYIQTDPLLTGKQYTGPTGESETQERQERRRQAAVGLRGEILIGVREIVSLW